MDACDRWWAKLDQKGFSNLALIFDSVNFARVGHWTQVDDAFPYNVPISPYIFRWHGTIRICSAVPWQKIAQTQIGKHTLSAGIMKAATGGKNGQPNSSSSTAADFQMSPKNHGTTTVRHRKPNNEQQRKDGPILKRTMSALGVAALALGAGQSVEAGRPLGAIMEQTMAPPPNPMQMSREANSPLLCDCETNPTPAVPVYSPPPPLPMFLPPPPATEGTLARPPPATEGTLAPPPPATEGALAPPPPATEGALAPPPPGGLVITGYPSANPDGFGNNVHEHNKGCLECCTCHCCVATCTWWHEHCCPPEN
ncbi:hypothetical protein niasHT_003200 [Heterodera trifolii]|uniref:Uncharacterized protein n=1 Tax=Heterodera trifolii TaxID=157864 RepID=A0ABD2LNX7_9BILA